jgi:DNA-binding response OmpR family regulator
MKRKMITSILPQKILLVENNPAAADEIRTALAAAGGGSFDVEWFRQLSDGVTRLNQGGIDAVLLELSLPVSLAAGVLQRKELIEYTRGAVKIVNRKKLEDSACECYRLSNSTMPSLA